MPKLTIDGKEVEAADGLNLIQAAEHVGIEIPHYCYHPALTIVGNCRMCLVEIEKAPKLQIACNTKVAEGMVVHTRSDKAKAAQRAVLEFLLINHPIDCPICDQAGECKLQDYYMDYDQAPSRFPLAEKNRKGKALDIGSDVMLDQERCILCARCTRFFDEVTKTSELAIFERGDHNRIDINPGQPINNKYAGNVIDICPVGALTEKDFRFRMRVWYLHRTASVCAGCERGCSIDIHQQRGRIYRYKPRFNPGVNDYWMCDEGRHSFLGLQHETRLTTPLVQSKDELIAETWGEAIRRAATIIGNFKHQNGARSIGLVIDAHATNEEAFALKQLMNTAIGSDRIAGLSWSPPGASGDDDLLIRANKNPNTRGLAALGIAADGLDSMALAVAAGELKMLIAFRADIVRALGEAEFIKRFGALDYLLVLSTDANETCQMANQVWPLAAYPEIDGSFTNFKGRVQRIREAFPPPGDALSGLEAITRLGHALDGAERPKTAEAVFAEMANQVPAFKGLNFDGLGLHGLDLSKG
ncbi:MAG: 2Fe-2S iron-sulfur cluster-binding protein [Candidatus Binatus sp.]|uniref:2Fe-2S iron-sulfur cluster-binding protein n=1 Tax=Candidatus Binatus sp. TaxID=2811406 RepID=UPI002720D1CA|nr:2Fe-2S iron-sulfur cluster-binding protein [Candidatus Binatus sp.]MDO8433139.1 2Fe-2S iron-sulfur cluster-binding protein [Candidatus Binatus sp.]